jgi:hypothetical protein
MPLLLCKAGGGEGILSCSALTSADSLCLCNVASRKGDEIYFVEVSSLENFIAAILHLKQFSISSSDRPRFLIGSIKQGEYIKIRLDTHIIRNYHLGSVCIEG